MGFMEKQSAALSPEDRLTLPEADLAGAWEEIVSATSVDHMT